MNIKHIAVVGAYELKDGGFRGAVLNRETRERVASDVLPSLAEAKYWAQSKAYELYSNMEAYSLAAMRRKGEYLANVWVKA